MPETANILYTYYYPEAYILGPLSQLRVSIVLLVLQQCETSFTSSGSNTRHPLKSSK